MGKKKNRVRILQAALFLICLASGGTLLKEMVIEPRAYEQMTKQLKEEFPGEEPPGDPPSQGLPDEQPQEQPQQAGKENRDPAINLGAMQGQYPDIKGWLTIPGTNIDYPVLQSGEDDPEYYLKRDYRGEWNTNGSLFLQSDCEVSDSQNLSIYGHNMNSGAMFGNLEWFTAEDYWREHKVVLFETAQGTFAYEILSVMKADPSMFPFQQTDFSGNGGLMGYIRQAKELGLFGTGKMCEEPVQVLTLVTCSYEWDGARTVVVAARGPEIPGV